MRNIIAAMMVGGVMWVQAAAADDPATGPQPPLRPRDVVEVEAPPPLYFKPNPLDVWQFYAVDRAGKFQARVVLSPYGPFYLYNGMPFPWLSTRSIQVMPYLMD